MMEVDLYVSVDDGRGKRYSAAVKVAAPFIDAWRPVDLCDRPDVALLVLIGGRNAHTEETVCAVRKMRENYAKWRDLYRKYRELKDAGKDDEVAVAREQIRQPDRHNV